MKQGISSKIKGLDFVHWRTGIGIADASVGVCHGDIGKLGTEVNPEVQYDDTQCTLFIFATLSDPFDPDALPATCSRDAKNRFA